jgi:DNA ligase-1
MKYSKLVEVYEDLEQNPSRLKKTEILSNFLKTLKQEKDKEIIYLLQGRVWPDYMEEEFGISHQLSIKALSKTTGLSSSEIVKKLKKIGDLGKVAEATVSQKSQSTLFSSKLTTEKVIENLKKLPELQGKGTVDRKISLITELLTSATPLEAKYIIRTLLNDLRIGVASGTIRDSIVQACFTKEDKEASKLVQDAYDKSTDLALVFNQACKNKSALSKVTLSPGKPIKVMLALKAEDFEDAFKRVGKPAALEYKYDGFRMLINKDETGEIKIFTRRQDNVTKQFPEVKEYAEKFIKAKTYVIDAEAVGYDPKTKAYTPFQSVSQRIKRKYDIESMAKQLPVEINVFDIVYYNGKSLINEPFKERSKILRKITKKEKYKLKPAEQIITSNIKEAQKFNQKALGEGEEGIMIKNLESQYKPGSRVGHMLKLKTQAQELDLVITGAEYGKGKRAGWLSSFDIACKHEDKFLGIGKVGTGIKEKGDAVQEGGASFAELTKLLKPLIIEEKDKHIFVKPKIVIEVTYQDMQKSPTYNSGFALRFPRLARMRPDKKPSQIATLQEIKTDFKRIHK